MQTALAANNPATARKPGIAQDEDLAKADLRNQSRLESERMPWEQTYREIDERFPDGAGGFNGAQPGRIRGARNFDNTHITAIDRFAAAGVAITTPEESDYIRPKFLDEKLMAVRAVQLWCERAGRRLYALRHALHTGFGTAAHEDWDQLGRYGTSAIWQEPRPNGLSYRCLHLSECYIDADFSGLVNRVHRKYEKTARELAEQFKKENLTEAMQKALEPGGNPEARFEILHIVAPNTDWDEDKFDHRRFPIASRYLAISDKQYLSRGGFHTMPVSVSRHMTSAGETYGRSPAMKAMPAIQGVNAMKHTTLRAGHKAVDPALLFNDDDGVTTIRTKAGGLNPGMVDMMGRAKVARMPGGENGIPYAIDMIRDERETIKTHFLEEFYKILTDPNSRMTTTEVLEVMAKQGVLVRPYMNRYATEKQHPMTQRDLDLAMRAGQIDPFPPEVVEAGAWPVIDYENPLAEMARAQSTAKTIRFLQALPTLAEIEPNVRLRVDADAIAVGMARDMGVPPSYVRTDQQVAALAQNEAAQQQAAVDAERLERTAGAVKDFAQAEALGGGL